jgi:hypothetical protein
MSAAANQAMEHLNRVFQYGESSVSYLTDNADAEMRQDSRAEEMGFLMYVDKVNMIPIHRLRADELESCHM